MYTTRAVVLVSLAVAILVAGCGSLFQQNISTDSPPVALGEDGLILGSVTAPPVYYHETLVFHYRSVGDGGKTSGLITSATTMASIITKVPQCDEDGLADQCGRLFAIRLPAGEYEIYAVNEMEPGANHYQLPPLGFAVAKGRASYLGNLHTLFCEGLVRSTRGAILGGDLSVRDEYDRDVALLRAKYPQLAEASIDKQLLPDRAWRWRVKYEPYDWGTCVSK